MQKKIQSRLWVLIFKFSKKDLLIKLTLISHLTNTQISTSKLARSHGKLTNAEIIAEVTGTQEDNSDDEESDNVDGEPIIKPVIKEMQKATGILENFSLYSKFGEAMMRSLKELNFSVQKEYVFNKKQTLSLDFFLKQQIVILSMYICYVFDVFLLPYRLKLQ